MDKREIFEQIAESLASHYDALYYVNSENGKYTKFTSDPAFSKLEIQEKGEDFFTDAQRNTDEIVIAEDAEKVKYGLTKEKMLSTLKVKKQYTLDYSLRINGVPQYARSTITWASDKLHIIIGIENIDAEVRREQAQIKALNLANELARRDDLTGIKNCTAFRELERTVQNNLENGLDYLPFALVVCDINDLKHINDTLGHMAGDDYIKSACRLICHIFAHSPVYRIGGDEFAVFLGGSDFENKKTLFGELRAQVIDNLKSNNGPVIASGMAVFNNDTDASFTSVFQRADAMMYSDKKWLKSGAANKSKADSTVTVPDARKEQLDTMFEAFSIVAEGTYIYICDMKYDYSRWSKTAVDTFGLPSEYMFNAGDIWDKHIHPDDLEIYQNGIAAIFSGNVSEHDMQYRARKLNGDYVVCTCRGVVMYNKKGLPEYFCGTIRNQGAEGRIDSMTGLRNQYGFFEDLEAKMLKKIPVKAVMIGIGKFSEINEVYGYQFGNLVLQKFGRYLFEQVGTYGTVYRLDGTKFAIITSIRTIEEIYHKYSEMRRYFRSGFFIDNQFIILDTNAGLLNIDTFNIGYQTAYACLNFAYGESKLRRQGDLVEFLNELSDDNKQKIEKLHVIRASIMQDFHGFYLLYQPVVDAKTEKMIGAEALIRWRSEEYGMVPPDHFIPVLEKDPLFPELGRWILKTALLGAKDILKKHPDFVINVNLSYSQLEKLDFVDMVFDVLREVQFPPEHLCLEITERCRLLDIERLKNIIVNLRGIGVSIALDDFGTGFSSVGLVRTLPFDVIKIDRSFIMHIEQNMQDRELIRCFADVSSNYGAKVCAEGIETAEMRNILLDYRVHSLQGYYYSRPISLEEIMDFE